MGTNRQYVVESPIDGFNGKWKFNVDKKIVILFAIVLICVSTMRYGWIDTYAYKEMYLSLIHISSTFLKIYTKNKKEVLGRIRKLYKKRTNMRRYYCIFFMLNR